MGIEHKSFSFHALLFGDVMVRLRTSLKKSNVWRHSEVWVKR